MKTKEFSERIEELGFNVVVYDYCVLIEDDSNNVLATIGNMNDEVVLNSFSYFKKLENNIKEKMLNAIVTYANTPIEECEEPKKYYIRQKYIRNNWNYLNYNLDSKEWDFSSERETIEFKTKFILNELPNWAHEMLEQGHLIKEEVK